MVDRLPVTPEQRPGLDELLRLLGVSESAITDAPPADGHRLRYTIELYGAERDAIDDAARAFGVSDHSGAKLARAIVRAWLISPSQHPIALVDADLDGTTWAEDTQAVSDETAWARDATSDVERLVAQLLRLPAEQLTAVVTRLVAQLPAVLAADVLAAFSSPPRA